MSTTITLTLANFEVHRVFLRELKTGSNFYQEVLSKANSLMKISQEGRVFALLHLYHMHEAIKTTVNHFYDEIDKFEGVLEKKKHLAGKKLAFKPKHFPEIPFDNAIASVFVELFTVYDQLISQLKTLRTAGCFTNDNDYFNNLRRFFKSVNTLLSQCLLIPLKAMPSITIDEAIDRAEVYQTHAKVHGEMDYMLLQKALTSHIAPRLEEKIRQPLLVRLNQRLLEEENTKTHSQSIKEVTL
jgi:hypothetical protein